MKQLRNITLLLALCLWLSACSDAGQSNTSTSGGMASDIASQLPLNENSPTLGTAVVDVIDTTSAPKSAAQDFQDVLWDDLVPEGFHPETIFNRYKDQIEAAPEGSKEERVLYDKVMAEYNSVGANPLLNGKKVRIPGYIAPLDIQGNKIGDFLLVPYYGSCIHSPPPPAHQTVLVNPDANKNISLDDTYRPVWVIGEIEVEEVETSLAKASYQIKNAQVTPYVQPIH